MSGNINVVVLGGRLTRDVEVRYSDSGIAFANIGLALNNRVKKDDQWVEEVCFVDVKMSGKRAEAFGKFHGKGDLAIFPRCYLKMETWADKASGDNRSKLVVRAQDWEFAGGNRDNANAPDIFNADDPF